MTADAIGLISQGDGARLGACTGEIMAASGSEAGDLRAGSYRLTQLEAVRGIASLVVVFHHFALGFVPAIRLRFPDGIAGTPLFCLINGSAAVTLFFVLSGFVLTRRYFDRGRAGGELAIAAAKRMPRLWVPATASAILAWLVISLDLTWNVEAARSTGSDWLRLYANAGFPAVYRPDFATVMGQSVTLFFHPANPGLVNTNLWTMYFELFGSMLCFAIVWLLLAMEARRWWPVVPAGMTVLALIAVLGAAALPFLLGACLARFYRHGGLSLSKIGGIGLMLAGLALCGMDGFVPENIGAVIILLAVLACPSLARGLSGRFGNFLGRYSFPVYLVHLTVILSASSFVFVKLNDRGWDEALVLLGTGVVTLVLTFLAAWPFVALEDWWVPKLNRIAGIVQRGLSPSRPA